MEKVNIDLDQEIVITCGDLVNLIEGLALISEDLSDVQSKMTSKENHKLLVKTMALFVAVARLFPKMQKKEIFELLKREVGVDLTEIL